MRADGNPATEGISSRHEIMSLDHKEIVEQLKPLILSGLRITDATPAEMNEDMRLLDGNWEIDSIDILQLIVEIERNFGIKLVSGRFDRSVWHTIGTLAATIQTKLKDSISA